MPSAENFFCEKVLHALKYPASQSRPHRHIQLINSFTRDEGGMLMDESQGASTRLIKFKLIYQEEETP